MNGTTNSKKKILKTAALAAVVGTSLYLGTLIRKPVEIIEMPPVNAPVTKTEKRAHAHKKAHPVYREPENREPEEKRVPPIQKEQTREPVRYAQEQPRQYEQVAQVQEPCSAVQTSTYSGGWGGAGSSVSTQGAICGKNQQILERQTVQANQNGINNANEMSKAQIRQQNAIAMQQMAIAAQQGANAVRSVRNVLRRY